MTSAMKFSARFDAPARANEPLAENVLLGDQRDIGGLETGIEAEHGERDLRARQRQRLRPRRDMTRD